MCRYLVRIMTWINKLYFKLMGKLITCGKNCIYLIFPYIICFFSILQLHVIVFQQNKKIYYRRYFLAFSFSECNVIIIFNIKRAREHSIDYLWNSEMLQCRYGVSHWDEKNWSSKNLRIMSKYFINNKMTV